MPTNVFATDKAFLCLLFLTVLLVTLASGIAVSSMTTVDEVNKLKRSSENAIDGRQLPDNTIKDRFLLRHHQLHYGRKMVMDSSSSSFTASMHEQFPTYARMRRTKRRRRTSRHSIGISRVLVETANCEHVELVDCGDYWDKGMRCMLTATGMPCCICNGRLRFRRRKLRHHHHNPQSRQGQNNDDRLHHSERDNAEEEQTVEEGSIHIYNDNNNDNVKLESERIVEGGEENGTGNANSSKQQMDSSPSASS